MCKNNTPISNRKAAIIAVYLCTYYFLGHFQEVFLYSCFFFCGFFDVFQLKSLVNYLLFNEKKILKVNLWILENRYKSLDTDFGIFGSLRSATWGRLFVEKWEAKALENFENELLNLRKIFVKYWFEVHTKRI